MEQMDAARVLETDILAEAANAQFRAVDFMGAGVVRGIAPAKVNLFLGVGDKRSDGRHDVVNVMHALSLHDVLHVNALPLDEDGAARLADAMAAGAASHARTGDDGCLFVSVDMVDKTAGLGETPEEATSIPAADNLAFKAVQLLAAELGRGGSEHVRIRIEKQIPSQAGLGGGSADAACVLACLAKLWDVQDETLLQRVAMRIGADVAFFLQGGAALYEGAGDHFVHALTPLTSPLLVVKPHAGVSTKAAYAAFDAEPDLPPSDLVARAQNAGDAGAVPLFNGLENAARIVQPETERVREWLCAQDGVDPERVLMSGSGSAFFAEMDAFAQASRISSAARQAGFWARPTAFARLRAQAL